MYVEWCSLKEKNLTTKLSYWYKGNLHTVYNGLLVTFANPPPISTTFEEEGGRKEIGESLLFFYGLTFQQSKEEERQRYKQTDIGPWRQDPAEASSNETGVDWTKLFLGERFMPVKEFLVFSVAGGLRICILLMGKGRIRSCTACLSIRLRAASQPK